MVFPSPYGVGLIAETRTSFPYLLSLFFGSTLAKSSPYKRKSFIFNVHHLIFLHLISYNPKQKAATCLITILENINLSLLKTGSIMFNLLKIDNNDKVHAEILILKAN